MNDQEDNTTGSTKDQLSQSLSTSNDTKNKILDNEPNILIFNRAGKPIYARYGKDEEISNVCAILQAIISTSENEHNSIQSIHAGKLQMIIHSIQQIILVIIHKSNQPKSELFLRMILEYVYAQIVFTLTDQIQEMISLRSNLDYCTLVGRSATNHLNTMLHQIQTDPAPYLLSAIPILYPLDHFLRHYTSKLLQNIGTTTNGILYAIMMAHDKLITLVQPKYTPHQLFVSDIHLILTFVKSQLPFLLKNEAWLPLCLPFFHSDGYMHAYTTCLDNETGLILMLISNNETQQQFDMFRNAANQIKQELNVFTKNDGMNLDITTLFIPLDPMIGASTLNDNNHKIHDNHYDNHNKSSMNPTTTSSTFPLSRAISQALRHDIQISTMKQYCNIASAYHFIFRFNVPLTSTHPPSNSKKSNKSKKYYTKQQIHTLTQCLSPPLSFPFVDQSSKQRVWDIYQSLLLRLKIKSSSNYSIRYAYDHQTTFPSMNQKHTTKNNDDDEDDDEDDDNMDPIMDYSILSMCPSIQILESSPFIQGMTYIIDQHELFLALNGHDFLFLTVLPKTMDLSSSIASCTKMIHQIKKDQLNLFLGKPLTWRS